MTTEHPPISVTCYGATLNAIPTLRAEGHVVRYHVGPHTGLSPTAVVDQLVQAYGITRPQARQLVDMTSACYTIIALDQAEQHKPHEGE